MSKASLVAPDTPRLRVDHGILKPGAFQDATKDSEEIETLFALAQRKADLSRYKRVRHMRKPEGKKIMSPFLKTEKAATDSERSERDADQSSSLLAMLLGGLVLIVVGTIIVMTFV